LKTEANQTIHTVWYHVEGIVCYACVGIIESAVKTVRGVKKAAVSYIGESLCVEAWDDADLDAVSAVLESGVIKQAV
jgi:hypothetical protein